MALNARQSRFVLEYLKDLNGTQAAIRAGYSSGSADVTAARLLGKAKVRRAVESAIAQRAARVEVRADDVLRELYRLATVDVAQAVDPATGKLRPLHEMSVDVRSAIASIETEELWEGRGEDRTRLGDLVKVRFWDKKGALDSLAKHLGMFIDRTEHSGTVQLEHSEMTPDERRAAIERLRKEVAPQKP